MFLVRRFHQNSLPQPIIQAPSAPFDYKNPAHLLTIQAKLSVFNSAAFRLKRNDYCLALGAAIMSFGVFACLSLMSIVFFLVMADAFMLIRDSFNARFSLFEEYKTALNDLINLYQWAMPKEHCHWDALGLEPVQNLILTLGPLVPAEIIHTWQPADLESVKQIFGERGNYLKESLEFASSSIGLTSRTEPSEQFKKQLIELANGTHQRSFHYRLYGHNSVVNPLAFISNISNVFKSFKPAINQVTSEVIHSALAVKPG